MKPQPLKGKIYDCPCGYIKCTKVADVPDIRSAMEWYDEKCDQHQDGGELWDEYMRNPKGMKWTTWLLEKAFEDVFK